VTNADTNPIDAGADTADAARASDVSAASPLSSPRRPTHSVAAVGLSVIIKTYNEEENIAQAIETSLSALPQGEGEVIVADSGSTDRTIEMARRYPVTIVQLARPEERCCGIGPQMGYQVSRGSFIYVLDGDMTLDKDFISVGLAMLSRDPTLAGVGGVIPEMRINNIEFSSRLKRQLRRRPKDGSVVNCLNGGGLYRRAAIESVGYFSDRNLHAFEEFDLGARLRAKGWKLVFLDRRSASHYGYTLSTYKLLWRRLTSRYVYGSGELIKAAVAGGYVFDTLRKLPALRVAMGVWVYWIFAALTLLWAPSAGWAILGLAAYAVAPVLVMTLRNNRALEVGVHSVATWHVAALGFVLGLAGSRRNPRSEIAVRVLADPRSGNGNERPFPAPPKLTGR